MAKESILKTDKNLIFKETFQSADAVARNGGTVTGVTFSNGVGTFGGADTWKITYKSPPTGVYTVRCRFRNLTLSTRYLFDVSNGNTTGSGYAHVNATTGNIYKSSGTIYVDGVAATAATTSSTEVVISGITLTGDLGVLTVGNCYSATNSYYSLQANYELFEIYKGTLTANEVKNLYENRQNREINNYSKQLVVNPDFLTDTSWTKESGWTISSGAARCDGTNSARLTQDLGMIATQQYKVSYKINVTSGSVSLLLGGNGAATVISANSETSEIKVSGATASGTIYLISTNFVGSIDYIYVEQIAKEILRVDARNGVIANKYTGSVTGTELGSVLTLWSKSGTGTVTDSGNAVQFVSAQANYVYKSIGSVNKRYLIAIKASSTANGDAIRVYQGATAGATAFTLTTSPITYTAIITDTSDPTMYIQGLAGSGTVTVELISIQEIIPSVTPTAVSVVRSGNVYAMDFNGSTSKIDCGSYNTLVGNKTVLVWIKPRTSGEIAGRIMDNAQFVMNLMANGTAIDKVRFTRNYYAAYLDSATGVAYLSKWKMIAVTSTSTGVSNIYFDGVLNGTANQAGGTPVAGTATLLIGNSTPTDRTFDGQLSNVRIIDGILSTQEIAQIYQSEKTNYGL